MDFYKTLNCRWHQCGTSLWWNCQIVKFSMKNPAPRFCHALSLCKLSRSVISTFSQVEHSLLHQGYPQPKQTWNSQIILVKRVHLADHNQIFFYHLYLIPLSSYNISINSFQGLHKCTILLLNSQHAGSKNILQPVYECVWSITSFQFHLEKGG